MKLTVFAHTPPPHHGQSYMVKLMVEGFGGDHCASHHESPATTSNSYGIECYHVNARLSRDLEDVGEMRTLKAFTLIGYCLQAIWIRFRHRVETLYYVPSPGKRSALIRDWIVMALCRPFYPRVVLHWHAAGLADWLETAAQQPTRRATYRLLRNADLCIVLSEFNRADAEKLWPRHVQIVHNGIPDPCPDFAERVLPLRHLQFETRRALVARKPLPGAAKARGNPGVVRVLYLAHCTRDKGLFDAIEGVRLANRELRRTRSPLSLHLNIAGSFINEREQIEFDLLLKDDEIARQVTYLGFVAGERKHQELLEADLFCFPTFYGNENQPVNVIEAMAYGLPVVTTRWRSVPESFPPGYVGFAEPRQPSQLAQAVLQVLEGDHAEALRRHFLEHFVLEMHLRRLSEAINSVNTSNGTPAV